jgi:hypothetical protein
MLGLQAGGLVGQTFIGRLLRHAVGLDPLRPLNSMIKKLLIVTFCLSSPALTFAQQRALPQGLPHPTQLVDDATLEALADGASLDDFEWPLWRELQPSVLLQGADDLNMEAARADRAEALAGLNDWSEAQTLSWLRSTAPKPIQVSYVIRQAGQVLASGSQPVLPGTPVTLGMSTMTSVVAELDVEIAQGASVADPYLKNLFAGTSLGIDLLPVPGKGWWTELALTGSRALESEKINTGYSQISGKGRVRQSYFEMSASVLLEQGKASRMALPGFKMGQPVELEITVNDAPPSGMHDAGRYLCLDLPTLPVDAELATSIRDHEGSVVWASSAGLVILKKDTGQMIATELLRTAAEISVVDLSLNLTSDEREGGQAVLRLATISGRPVHFSAGEAFDSLVDWDVEVASTARIADPVYRRLYSGVTGMAGATVVAGELVESELFLELSVSKVGPSLPLTLSGELPLSDSSGGILPATQVLCEHPIQAHGLFSWKGGLDAVELRRSLPAIFDLGDQVVVRLSTSLVGPN